MNKVILFLFLISINVEAYVTTFTEYGKKLRWVKRSETLNISVNPNPIGNNAIGIDALDVQNVVEESIDQWNQVSPYELKASYTNSALPLGQGLTISFSDEEAYFGSGVLAITSIGYNAKSGNLFSADVLFNESLNNNTLFTINKSISSGHNAYLGDVLTHELGHLLGLGHSEVAESSMIFSVFKGQHLISSDDAEGIASLYENEFNTHQYTGSISGTVIGGNSIPVFGVHVQLIDVDTGSVYAGVFTDEEGRFIFRGLSSAKNYVIYLNPVRSAENLIEYYSTIQSAYCNGQSFQPSFFSKCGGSSYGGAQVLNVSHSLNKNLDVGEISIQCNTPVSPEYLHTKFSASDYEYELISAGSSKFNKTFTGYFSKQEIAEGPSGEGDKFSLDLRSLDTTGLYSGYVNVKVLTSRLGSAVGVKALVKRSDQASWTTHTYAVDTLTGKLKLNLDFNLPLSLVASDNIYSIILYPLPLTDSEKTAIFAAPSLLTNSNSIYYLQAISKVNYGSGFENYNNPDSYPYDDNRYCSQGDITQTAKAYNPIFSDPSAGSSNTEAVSCGTIDLEGDGGGRGPGIMLSFLLGFLSIFFYGSLRKVL